MTPPGGPIDPSATRPTAPDASRPSAGRLALRAARLHDGTGGPVRRDPLVVIADGRIEAVEDATVVGDPGCPVEDLGDVTMLPGLIDAHIHLAWIEPDASEAERDGLLLRAADRAARALAGGVTLARDLGGPGDVTLRLRDAIAAGVVPGPDLLVAGPPLTTPNGHCHWLGAHATSEAEVRDAVERLAAMGVDVVKVMLTGGMATPTTDPYGRQYPLEIARVAVEVAHRAGLPVAAHALGTSGVRVALAAGVDTLEHGWTITGREQHYDPSVIDEMRGAPIVASVSAHHALRGLLARPGPDGVPVGGDEAELRRRLVPHRAVAAAGVPIVAHSDAGPATTRYEAFGESLEVFATGMRTTIAAAVLATTLVPARALGVDASRGAVRPGRRADLVTVAGDPERDVRALRDVVDVRLGGRLVARRGALVQSSVSGPSASSVAPVTRA